MARRRVTDLTHPRTRVLEGGEGALARTAQNPARIQVIIIVIKNRIRVCREIWRRTRRNPAGTSSDAPPAPPCTRAAAARGAAPAQGDMTGKQYILPFAPPATPTKDRPEEAPATPEAVRVEPQLAGGELGDGLERSSPIMWWWA